MIKMEMFVSPGVDLEILCDDQANKSVMDILQSFLGIGSKQEGKVFVSSVGESCNLKFK
ncbi:MAG: hypothetical protein OEM02_01345 [Desulfobulbaceae bacterium]|nr:hypothetical protein [Desulfobulbaceae bacterium]